MSAYDAFCNDLNSLSDSQTKELGRIYAASLRLLVSGATKLQVLEVK